MPARRWRRRRSRSSSIEWPLDVVDGSALGEPGFREEEEEAAGVFSAFRIPGSSSLARSCVLGILQELLVQYLSSLLSLHSLETR